MSAKIVVNPGDRFGRLTIIDEVKPYISHRQKPYRKFLCKCQCGTNTTVLLMSLRKGHTLSCGCLQIGIATDINTVHGESKRKEVTKEYKAFLGAKMRCNNPKSKSFPRYGGRGIIFNLNNIADLINDIGRAPTKKHTLGRINNEGHYEIGNIRWETAKDQANNRRTSRFITIDGVTRTIAQWQNVSSVSCSAIKKRIDRDGFCNKCAIFNPPKVRCTHN